MSNQDYTVAEEFILPSKGLVYDTIIKPNVKMRSMTARDEMKRLAPTDTPYKTMAGVIEGCIIEKDPKLSVYDLCLGDYQYLLYMLRVVTYGSDYKTTTTCPYCGEFINSTVQITDLPLKEYDESIKDLFTITLPTTKKVIKLKLQTPRSLDKISTQRKEISKKIKAAGGEAVDKELVLNLQSYIDTIDGTVPAAVELEKFAQDLPMKDVNYLIQKANKLNDAIGVSDEIEMKCEACGNEFPSTFRITREFFGPEVD